MANIITSSVNPGLNDTHSGAGRYGGPTGFGSLFTALRSRFVSARQRRVDREVGQFLEANGGHLTDDLERQISRRFGLHAG